MGCLRVGLARLLTFYGIVSVGMLILCCLNKAKCTWIEVLLNGRCEGRHFDILMRLKDLLEVFVDIRILFTSNCDLAIQDEHF